MKKIVAFLLAMLLLLSMAACDSGENNPTSQPKETFTFTYNGTKISLNADAAPIVAALGTPKSYTEEPSCAFDGIDKTYYYGSFYMSTYPMNGKDYVFSIWFADDSVATQEGIRIGSAKTAVEAAYGADTFNGSNAYVVNKGETKLTVILKDDAVSSVQYEVIVD